MEKIGCQFIKYETTAIQNPSQCVIVVNIKKKYFVLFSYKTKRKSITKTNLYGKSTKSTIHITSCY